MNNKLHRHIIPFHNRSVLPDSFDFIRQEIDRLFDAGFSLEGLNPGLESKESENSIEITIELPGVSEENINLSLAKEILTIEGEKKSEDKKEGETYHIMERKYGSFYRSLKLPYAPDEKDVHASFKDGILRITIPKPQEFKRNDYKIPIQQN